MLRAQCISEFTRVNSIWRDLRFTNMKHNRKGTYALTVEGNWRITFKWDGERPYDVELEDYPGR